MSELKTTGLWRDGDKIIDRRTQDVEPYLEHCANLRAAGITGSSEMRHAAKIPYVEIERYLALTGITMPEFMADPAHIKAMLNNPELSKYRIWKGKV